MEVTLIVIPVLWVLILEVFGFLSIASPSRWIGLCRVPGAFEEPFQLFTWCLSCKPIKLLTSQETTLSFVKHVMLKHPGQKLAAVDRCSRIPTLMPTSSPSPAGKTEPESPGMGHGVCGNSHEPRHRSRRRTKRSAQLVRAADMRLDAQAPQQNRVSNNTNWTPELYHTSGIGNIQKCYWITKPSPQPRAISCYFTLFDQISFVGWLGKY